MFRTERVCMEVITCMLHNYNDMNTCAQNSDREILYRILYFKVIGNILATLR